MSDNSLNTVKKKKEDIWKEKANIFFDILKIEQIIIIHKDTSSIIGQKNIHESLFDIESISKLLQDIMNYELNSKKIEISPRDFQKEFFIFKFKDYKIIVEDGNFIRAGIILNSIPSYYLHKSLETFVKLYEKENQEFLKSFTRKIIEYPDYSSLIEKIFDISLIFPHIVNLTPLSTNISPFQDEILNVATDIQKENGKFFISQLLNQLLKKKSKEPKEKLIAYIYDLRQYGYINSLKG